jgi:hypothetical protein
MGPGLAISPWEAGHQLLVIPGVLSIADYAAFAPPVRRLAVWDLLSTSVFRI